MKDASFRLPIEVRFRDLDALGHVNNAVYLTYLESARVAWWLHLTGRKDLGQAYRRHLLSFDPDQLYPRINGMHMLWLFDMALWDLKGKALGLPVCQLLGGILHNRVMAMGSIIFDMEDFEWTLNEFRWMREQGYRIVKAGWGMRPEAVFGQDRQKDLEIVRQVREVIGDELELVVDTPGARGIWDVPTAIQRFRDLEPYRLKWIEQPLPPQDLEGHARLRAAVATPIGTGEDEWNTESYRRLIQSKGVDVEIGRASCRERVCNGV